MFGKNYLKVTQCARSRSCKIKEDFKKISKLLAVAGIGQRQVFLPEKIF